MEGFFSDPLDQRLYYLNDTTFRGNLKTKVCSFRILYSSTSEVGKCLNLTTDYVSSKKFQFSFFFCETIYKVIDNSIRASLSNSPKLLKCLLAKERKKIVG